MQWRGEAASLGWANIFDTLFCEVHGLWSERTNLAKKLPKLDLSDLGRSPGFPNLTPAKGQSLAEAAVVCLKNRRHQPGKRLKVFGTQNVEYGLEWPMATNQMERTHNDLQDATEDGACAVALSLSFKMKGLTFIERSWKGPGFDYWIGKVAGGIFQNKTRLEVSGILKGEESEIQGRIK